MNISFQVYYSLGMYKRYTNIHTWYVTVDYVADNKYPVWDIRYCSINIIRSDFKNCLSSLRSHSNSYGFTFIHTIHNFSFRLHDFEILVKLVWISNHSTSFPLISSVLLDVDCVLVIKISKLLRVKIVYIPSLFYIHSSNGYNIADVVHFITAEYQCNRVRDIILSEIRL